MRRMLYGALGILLVAACDDGVTPTDPGEDVATLAARAASTNLVDVIVVLDPAGAPGAHAANRARAGEVARGLGSNPKVTYGTALFGFAASIPERRLNGLRNDPKVLYVELDGIASVPFPRRSAPRWCTPESTHPACLGEEEDPASGSQTTPWGITRVGGSVSGASGTAWIIDTGIDPNHADLNIDAGRSRNFVQRGKNDWKDGHGHGTHVAGTVAAIDNDRDVLGVAAGATVVAVRVLDNGGSGAYSWVIAGVDYVAAEKAKAPGDVDVANMSLGGPPNQALSDAVVAAASAGVKFALAAGNSGDDAANHEPARVNHPNVYTVSAIDNSDCMASWSNWGNPPVDYAAPGVGILSTKKGGGTTTMSGTSMAAPHMAGILLLGTPTTDGFAICDPDGNADPIAHRR